MTEQDAPKDYDVERWNAYSDAVIRLAKVRGAARNQLGSADRFWWAERDLWRKRRECVGG